MASPCHKDWIWPARYFFLVPTSAGQTNYHFQYASGVLSTASRLKGLALIKRIAADPGHQAFFYQLNGATPFFGLRHQIYRSYNVDLRSSSSVLFSLWHIQIVRGMVISGNNKANKSKQCNSSNWQGQLGYQNSDVNLKLRFQSNFSEAIFINN